MSMPHLESHWIHLRDGSWLRLPVFIHHPMGIREEHVYGVGQGEFLRMVMFWLDKPIPVHYIFLCEEKWYLSWEQGSYRWRGLHCAQSEASGGLPCKWFTAIISRVSPWDGSHQSLTGIGNKLVSPQTWHLWPISADQPFLPLTWKTVLIEG